MLKLRGRGAIKTWAQFYKKKNYYSKLLEVENIHFSGAAEPNAQGAHLRNQYLEHY